MHFKLSDRSITELDPIKLLQNKPHSQCVVYDSKISGFFVIVGKKTKSFAIQADLRQNKKRLKTIRRTIGRFGEITTRRARLIASQDLLSISQGIIPPHRDRFGTPRTAFYQAPSTDRIIKNTVTLRQAWEKYRTNHMERKNRSPNTIRSYHNYINNNVSDWLDRPLSSFVNSTEEVVDRYNYMIEHNGIATANNVMRVFRAVYRYASDKLDRSLPEKHPVTAIDFYEMKRRNTAMGPDDLKKWNKQRKALNSLIRREFHLFTLLSGHRPDALKKSKRGHLSILKGTLHIPEPKGGAERAFDIPLSRPMRRCLIRAIKFGEQNFPNSEWIFPAHNSKSGHLSSQNEDRATLSHWGNDLRQTYRTMAEYAEVTELQIKILMNHKIDRDVNAGYITVSKLHKKLMEAQTAISGEVMKYIDDSSL